MMTFDLVILRTLPNITNIENARYLQHMFIAYPHPFSYPPLPHSWLDPDPEPALMFLT
jgi:hypothetical protein